MNTVYNTEAALEAASVLSDPTTDEWLKIANPSTSFTHSFDTTVITNGSSPNYNLYIAAVDSAGNNIGGIGNVSYRYKI